MVFYFSGTGNSRFVAERFAVGTDDQAVSMVDTANTGNFTCRLRPGERLGFVMPVYFWGIPLYARDFLSRLHVEGEDCPYTYLIFTCGGSSCNAVRYFKEYFQPDYWAQVVMPDNYILLYDKHPDDVKRILEKARESLIPILAAVRLKKAEEKGHTIGPLDRLTSRLAYPRYLKGRKTASFHAEADCTGCGLCAQICPDQIIAMEQGKPVWTQPQCTFCLACIHRCPKTALQYGGKTKSKRRYMHPMLTSPSPRKS